MITLYGIPNCDTVRKARRWLDAHEINYQFHNFRKEGLTELLLQNWVTELGWETLINRRGTSWRKLPEQERDGINQSTAIQLMLENPTLIKRPILDVGTSRHVGFSEAQYQELF
ncbi:ArsC family reductase [Pseudomonadota bacterium]